MPTEEFTGASLEEVRQAVERWKGAHPGVTITKEHRPVEFLYGGTHFLGKNQGPAELIAVMVVIEYEDPNQGPSKPTSDQAKS